jgi:hypothetical protein
MPQLLAHVLASGQNEEPSFFSEKPGIECDECHQNIHLPSAELEDGYEFQCRHCRAAFEGWVIQPFVEANLECA